MVSKIVSALEEIKQWEANSIESTMRELSTNSAIKLGSLAQPLRVAVTGTTASPSVFEIIMALGKEETIARISDPQKMIPK